MSDKTTILYVDDEVLNLQLFQINFSKRYHVILAQSGYEGLHKLKTNSNILITISDMKMPGMTGIEFVKKAREEFPNIAFFILTGFDITEEISKALSDKLIIRYFRKPFNKKEIESSIEEALLV